MHRPPERKMPVLMLNGTPIRCREIVIEGEKYSSLGIIPTGTCFLHYLQKTDNQYMQKITRLIKEPTTDRTRTGRLLLIAEDW